MSVLAAIRNSGLKVKLTAIALLPLVGLTYFAAQVALERRAGAAEAAHMALLVDLSVVIGRVVHETQRERGLTALYISSKGASSGSELTAQRRQTDQQLGDLRAFMAAQSDELSESIRTHVGGALDQTAQLGDLRARVTPLADQVATFVAYYTRLNGRLLESIASIASASSAASVTRMATAYVSLLRAKEAMGLERAQLANVFSRRAFAPGQFVTLVSLVAARDAQVAAFSELASAEIVAAYRERLQRGSFAAADAYEKAAIEAAAIDTLDVTAQRWFDAATKKIDALHEVEQAQAAELVAVVTASRAAAGRAMSVALAVWLLLSAVAISQVVVFSRQITQPVARAVQALRRVASGDLTVPLTITSKDEIGQIVGSLAQALSATRRTLQQVKTVSGDLSTAARELSQAAEQISGGAQQQASALEQTAASLQLMSATATRNADNARHATEIAGETAGSAERGQRVVEQAVGAMGEITGASRRITDILSTINDIAFQTNLLALNAAVEAARAGEQGRGFAVVAGEVRVLSQRTTSAAREIDVLIGDASKKVDGGVRQVNQSGDALRAIVASVQRMNTMVSEIAAASGEQRASIGQVNTAVSQMDRVTQSNAAQTEELSATAAQLANLAQTLQALIARFELGSGEELEDAPSRAAAIVSLESAPPRSGHYPSRGALAVRDAKPSALSSNMASRGRRSRSG